MGRGRRTWRMNLWYFQREGRCETVRSVIPNSTTPLISLHPLTPKGEGHTSSMIIERLLNSERNCTRALIENGVLGTMVEETCHGDALLVSSRKCVPPFSSHVPASLALDDTVNLEDGEDAKEVGVCYSACRTTRQ